MNTLFLKVRLTLGYMYGQIFANCIGFTKFYPMQKESQAHQTLSSFIHEVGIPHKLHSDNANTLTLGEMARKLRKYEIFQTLLEPYSQFQNFAENCI